MGSSVSNIAVNMIYRIMLYVLIDIPVKSVVIERMNKKEYDRKTSGY